MKKLLILAAMALAGGVASFAQETKVFDCVADTWIREDAPTTSGATSHALEIHKNSNNQLFVGLMSFNYEMPAKSKVEKATLHLVTERVARNQTMDVYAYFNDFEENTTWGKENTGNNQFITSALAGRSVNFTPNGYVNPGVQTSQLMKNAPADYQQLSNWTNDIDVTELVKSFSTTSNRVNFLLTQTFNTEKTQVHTKEADEADLPSWDDSLTPSDLHPYLEVVFVEDTKTDSASLNPFADTIVRSSSLDDSYGTEVAMEIKSVADGTNFFGLLGFYLPQEVLDTENYLITGATLRLVCVQNKGDRNMDLYGYDNTVSEKATYGTETEYIEKALASDPIVETFQAKGAGNMSMGDDKDPVWKEEYLTVDGWTSYLDITNYVVAKVAEGSKEVNFLLRKKNTHDAAMKFGTKEAKTIQNDGEKSNNGTAFSFNGDDLKPLLTITFVKRPTAPKHSYDESTDNLAQTIKIVTDAEDTLWYRHFIYTPENNTAQMSAPRKAALLSDAAPVEDAAEEAVFTKAAKGDVIPTIDDDNDDETVTYHFSTAALVNANGRTGGFDGLKENEILHLLTYTVDSYNIASPVVTTGVVKTSDGNGATSGIENVSVDNANAPIEFFNLQGVRVVNPADGGIYIMRQGSTVKKVIF